LISAHVLAKQLQQKDDGSSRFQWYNDELLKMTEDLADRLLPAFNTTSGLPHPRVNLKRGMQKHLKDQVDTCTACSGTMILEMAALSRLTGNKIYEETAKKAMDFLWAQRNLGSDLVGTVLNVENGNWVRRESGIGAGIDSYFEYSLKAYILFGEEDYLYRFNKHYEAVMRYVNKGPMFIDVHMHKPNVASRPYMDSLLAFWPGMQVLMGDLKSAIEIHEMLFQVVQKYKFLPEAFTHDFQIHWAQHPIRPEFIESTYIIYRATKDPHYLEVAEHVMESIEKYTKVKCGYAGIKDLRTMEHEDRLDSFVLAETFKYLYLIFADNNELPFDPDSYVLTTEAHFLPLSMGDKFDPSQQLPRRVVIDPDEIMAEEISRKYNSACPNVASQYRTSIELTHFGTTIRSSVKKLLGNVFDARNAGQDETCQKTNERLRAWAFSTTNTDHLSQLKSMGIEVQVDSEGRVMLIHRASAAKSTEFENLGLTFMKEMLEFNKQQESELLNLIRVERSVQVLSAPVYGKADYAASNAQFGLNLNTTAVIGSLALASPLQSCSPLKNARQLEGKIVLVRRGGCMFQEKARFAQSAGAIGVIVADNQEDSSFATSPLFSMSGDLSVEDDIKIPVVLLFNLEAQKLLNHHFKKPVVIRMGKNPINPALIVVEYFKGTRKYEADKTLPVANQMLTLDAKKETMRINFRFNGINKESKADEKQKAVADNIELLSSHISFINPADLKNFINHIRKIAYSLLGFQNELDAKELKQIKDLISRVIVHQDDDIPKAITTKFEKLSSHGTTSVICNLSKEKSMGCKLLI
jgi:mannosidase alpha-like ER degradation enhancer 3